MWIPPRLDLRWYILPRRDEIYEISKYATNTYIIVIIMIIIMMMMMMMMMMIMITILMILIIIMKCWNLFIDTQRFFTGGQFNISFFCDYSQLIDKNSTRPLTMGHDSTGKERHCLLAVLIICGRTSLLELWSKNIQNLEINSISLHQAFSLCSFTQSLRHFYLLLFRNNGLIFYTSKVFGSW